MFCSRVVKLSFCVMVDDFSIVKKAGAAAGQILVSAVMVMSMDSKSMMLLLCMIESCCTMGCERTKAKSKIKIKKMKSMVMKSSLSGAPSISIW